MRPPGGLPPRVRRVLLRLAPAERREEVLADLEASFESRRRRLGEAAARRYLWREAAALLAWRVRAALQPPPGEPEPGGHVLRDGARATAPAAIVRDVLHDLRFGVRTLARRPAFALTAIVVLGLGIGAPTTVLTLVSRIFFERPPHVAEPHRLVRVWRSWAPGEGGGSLQHPDVVHYRENASTLEGLAAWGGRVTASWTLEGAEADQLEGTFVTHDWFDVLGVRPQDGRFFRAEENETPGAAPVMVVSDGFRRRAMAGEGGAVGREILVNGIRFTVVGVAPPGFRGLSPVGDVPDAWFPVAMFGALTRAGHTGWWERVLNQRWSWLQVAGRLRSGVTLEAARSELEALSSTLAHPDRDETEGVLVTREALYSPSQAATLSTLFRMLLGVVLMVLVIATANVAVLQLSRATTRTREMSVRAALGAGRGRLLRQLLVESLVLGLAGGALGVGLAFAFSDAAAALLPFRFPGGFTPDGRVLAGAAALSVLTAVAAGLLPAAHAARREPGPSGAPRRGDGGGRVRDGLVVGQVALSLVLLAGALLFARSFWTARTQDLGFATEDRLVLGVDLRALGYSDDEGRAFVGRALERLRGLPGVRAATTTVRLPFRGEWSTDIDPPEGAIPNTEDGKLWVGLNAVSPDYFEVMGMPLLRGRGVTEADGDAGGTAVVVVNETLAALLWPGRDPVGRTVPLDVDRTVVGVARDATYYELGEAPTTQAWVPVRQAYQPVVHFVVRTAGGAAELAPAAQEALRGIDPGLAFGEVTTLEAVFEEVTARYQVSAALVGLFGALAMALAAAGLYGVVSFLVARRTREIGVRMALGADRGRVAREVLRSGLGLAVLGVALGLAGALALRRFTESLLYGVTPEDPWTLAAACSLLVAVAGLASLGPARRATRVDPVEAMRAE